MKGIIIFVVVILAQTNSIFAQVNVEESKALIRRVVPKVAEQFKVENLKTSNKDEFEIESVQNKVVLRGDNGVAIASALYHYLKEYCNCQITWNGTNLKVPAVLPKVTGKIRK